MDGRTVFIGSIIPIILGGCTSPARVEMPPPRPLAAQYESTGQQPDRPISKQSPLVNPADVSTLQDALSLALLHNSELRAFVYEVRVAEAEQLQAGLWTNPELNLEVDEYNRDGAGFDSAETTLALSQKFQPGGQRRWRTQVAAIQGELAGWEYERKRLDVFTATTLCFISVLAEERRLEIADALVGLAEKSSKAVDERVKAGKELPLQATKAAAELELARLKKWEAQSSLEVSRRCLASMWGAETAEFRTLKGNLDSVMESLPPLERLQLQLAANPELEQWESELRLRHAALSLEKAQRIPEIEASIGVKHFEVDSTDALVFGVGIPLPFFDRNQGRIAASNYELAQAEANQIAVRNELTTELGSRYGEFSRAHQRVIILRSKMVPAMEETFEVAHESYREGKFDVLDMFDAQRRLFESKGAQVDALESYHASKAAIQRIIGISIEELIDNNLENVE